MITRRRRTNSGSERESSSSPSSGVQSVQRTYIAENTSHSPALRQDREMSCRDRTNEFLSAVKSLQSRQGNGHLNARSNGIVNHSEFTIISRRISRDLANTYAKLEKLTILARRRSLFDDKPVEIQELTYIIKQDIGNLNKQIAQLQELVRTQNHHSRGRHIQTHSNSVVVSLQSRLATMSNDFKSVLEVRTENLKKQKSRREQFSSQTPVSASMPPSAVAGQTGSVLLQDEANSSSDIAIDMDGVDSNRHMAQMQLIEQDDSYIQSRADTMQNIEQTIVELGGIFQQLATMVREQEEMVQRIDTNVEETQLNVEAAHTEIVKYFRSVTSNRWLMIKIFGILIIFFIIFVVFMA